MEQRTSIITLGVSRLRRSREFYERVGWRRSVANGEGIVFFQAGGMALALFPREQLPRFANVDAAGRGFSGFSLALNVRRREDMDSLLAEEKSADANIVKSWPGGCLGW